MSTTIPTSEPQQSKSATGWMLEAYRARRRRVLSRRRSMVRFKLTREGLHFVGVLLFIFFGAVIRDINLLILLAGAMIGLLVLQWRFNVRTLVGVKAARTLSTATSVGNPTNVLIRLTNPKRWLGSWLVLVEDPIRRKKPQKEKSSGTGSLIVDEVRPQGQSEGRYQLTFHQRGVYDIGPTTISTRFPIGLGRGWRTLNNQTSITVRPKLGELLPPSRVLFQLELQGSSVASSKSGPNEAEFYGLRPWVTGDSKRWIHWRTTARLGELAVRQFERQQHQQACLLLDLYQSGKASPEERDAQEQAVAFVASLAHKSVLTQKGKLAAAICGDHNYVSPIIQSPILVDNLLDELASIAPSASPDIENAIPGISLPLSSNPHLVVVSTRQRPENVFSNSAPHIDRLLSRITVNWLNVTAGELEPYFAWTSQE